MKPARIQRKRTKGWKMPENTVYVGRPTKWGNPFFIGIDGNADECVKKYTDLILPYSKKSGSLADLLLSEANIADIKAHLRGKNLACFCPLDQPCHADVLLEIANGAA